MYITYYVYNLLIQLVILIKKIILYYIIYKFIYNLNLNIKFRDVIKIIINFYNFQFLMKYQSIQ